MHFTPALLLELLAWNWLHAKKLAWWARQLVKDPAAETVARHVHNEVLRILRPAESMVRRMLLILASKDPISPLPLVNRVPSAHTSPTHNSPVSPAEVGAANPNRTSLFSLTEPLTIRLPSDAVPAVTFGPRIFVFGSGMDWRPLPSEAPLPPLPNAPLLGRLTRRDAVLAAPDAHAARLARLIARLRGAREAGRVTRLSPVRPRSLMPGRASRPLSELTQSAINYVCWGADAAMDGAWAPG
ncbi:MAG: hypothetical protein KJ871_10425 [Alphaproteobacteria bacterium]|nr:hypothetical protein [Alphaproteobacteria bacterium]MBU2082801.1 hypothetical protein [Alphaproteobacteria bacterium]MBU2142907.1 hypothetical protein [Alphaproteobacteria bacterium]MBU2197938.1 hypothetical protein [Alphaproteobacteria bacterium]